MLADVATASVDLPADLDLLVVGAPTHAFSLSRPSTRADAVRQGAPPERATAGLREWLTAAPPQDARRLPVAVFDTRVPYAAEGWSISRPSRPYPRGRWPISATSSSLIP